MSSCTSTDQEPKVKPEFDSNYSVYDDNRIIGTWEMCSYYNSEFSVQFNECHQYIFDANGTGSIITSGKRSMFTWSLNEGKLILNSAIQKVLNQQLNNKGNNVLFSTSDEGLNMTISNLENGYIQYLSRKE